MKTKFILNRLKEIEVIANFQQKRIKNKKAVNRGLVLKQSLDILLGYVVEIQEVLNEWTIWDGTENGH